MISESLYDLITTSIIQPLVCTLQRWVRVTIDPSGGIPIAQEMLKISI